MSISNSTWADGVRLVGRVSAIAGEVTVVSGQDAKNLSSAKNLTNGMSVYEGDLIRTSPSARVKIVFLKVPRGKSNEIVLSGGTDLVLNRSYNFETKKKGTVLFLKQGSVRSSVKERYSAQGDDVYEVRTPSVVAGVRGTIFQVDYDPQDKRAAVSTIKGQVAVHPRGDRAQTRLVNAGMFVLGQSKTLNTPAPYKSDAIMRKRLQDFEKSQDHLERSEKGKQAGVGILPKNLYGVSQEVWDENAPQSVYSEKELKNARNKGAAQEGILTEPKAQNSSDVGLFQIPVVVDPSTPKAGPKAVKQGVVPTKMQVKDRLQEAPHTPRLQDSTLLLKGKRALQ